MRRNGRSTQAARAVSAAEPAGRAGRVGARGRSALKLLASSLHRRIRPRVADRRSGHARRIADHMRRRPRGDDSRGPKATRTKHCSRRSAPAPPRSASSARPVSSPRTGRSSGATIGSNRGSIGRRGGEPGFALIAQRAIFAKPSLAYFKALVEPTTNAKPEKRRATSTASVKALSLNR